MSKLNHGTYLRHSLALIAALALCGSVLAEEAGKPAPAASPQSTPQVAKRGPRPGDVQRVFVIKAARIHELAEVLSVFPAAISYDHSSSTATALGVSAPPAVMAAIEETIKRLDIPPAPKKSVEVTAYIIQALAAPAADAKVPAVLDPVVAQLKNTFRYADYRLVDTLIARSIADVYTWLETSSFSEADIWSRGKAKYSLKARPAVVTTDGQRVVRMGQLRFTFEVPIEVGEHNYQTSSSGITADVDLGDGQTVVVGKSGTGLPGSALILVLSAKILD
jgi:hypothetical protein